MEIKSYLNDKEFLKQIDYQQEKDVYAKIMLLDLNDYPKDTIEGQVTGGSINIDGASAVRRSCNLTLTVTNKEVNDENSFVNDEYWSFNHKFRLEIGIKNLVDSKYPDILWFDQGTYIITSFTPSFTLNSMNVSIQGKDKMCKLNGEVSGNIPIETDFGTIEEVDAAGNIKITKLPLKTIIYNAVKEYGGERAENIIINDLDFTGFELWEYKGETPLYMFLQLDDNSFPKVLSISLDGNQSISWQEQANNKIATLSTFEANGGQFYSFNTLDPTYNFNATTIKYGSSSEKTFKVAKIKYGETAGYHQTPLVYNSDLILKPGETVTALLDKIKNMLGSYEYFYDLQGRFVFQKKKTYVDAIFSPVNGQVVTPNVYTPYYSYKFEDYKILTNISSPPKIDNIKNDFTLWGTKSGISGRDLPFHIRYALQKKPTQYVLPFDRYEVDQSFCYIKVTEIINKKEGSKEDRKKIYDENSGKLYCITSTNNEHKYDGYLQSTEFNANFNYYKIEKVDTVSKATNATPYYTFSDGTMSNRIRYIEYKQKNGITPPHNETSIYIKNKENDEYVSIKNYSNTPSLPYYKKVLTKNTTFTISEYDWRELMYQMAVDYYQFNEKDKYLIELEKANPQFIKGKTGYEQYYSDMLGFWRLLYNPNGDTDEFYGGSSEYKYWSKKIHNDPNSLLFWIDFLDVKGEISNYNIDKIGIRSKVVNENSIKSIYFKEIPEVLFNVNDEENLITNNERTAYTILYIDANTKELFDRSSQGMSAIQKINELIYQHTITTTSITLTSLPIYYLEPNTRIYVEGYGDYTLDKISYSLNYNGTMSLSGTKINKEFY